MTHVSRHQRITRGRATTVRAHERAIPVQHGTDTVWDDGTWNDTSSSSSAGSYWDDAEQAWVEPEPASEPSATCPACGGTFPVDVGGTLQGHRLDGPDYCPGSGLTEKQITRYQQRL